MTDPAPRVRQREMLALLVERFVGVVMITTGLQIMRSLIMFVDFNVWKGQSRNLLTC